MLEAPSRIQRAKLHARSELFAVSIHQHSPQTMTDAICRAHTVAKPAGLSRAKAASIAEGSAEATSRYPVPIASAIPTANLATRADLRPASSMYLPPPAPAALSTPVWRERPTRSNERHGSSRGVRAAGQDPPIRQVWARPVPQRRCRNRSQGEKSSLSAASPMATITSMMPMTWSIALSSRP